MSTYIDTLNAAWEQHLAPRQLNALTVISTFAGCGGSSLGYSMAGFRELLAVEWDDNAVATFRLNFPDVPVYHGDIAALSVEECCRLTNIKPGELDVLDGSPPCQGFSTAGKRRLDDPRNDLFRQFVRLLAGLQPRAFVMENVSGMVKGKMKLVFVECLRELKAAGYRVSARLMNAMYFGVPQSRERMIFVGTRNDLPTMPSHPKPSTRPIVVHEAIKDVISTSRQLTDAMYPAGKSQDLLLRQMKQGEGADKYHPKQSFFGLRRLSWNKPSGTILFQDGSGASCACCHPEEQRRLTIPEIQRIQSFPDEFQMVGSYKDQWSRIGNSVPPLFMRAIAEHLRQTVLSERIEDAA